MFNALIDPEEFPFTEAELCAAFALLQDDAQAEREAAMHAAGMRQEKVGRATFRARVAAPHSAPIEGVVGSSFGYGIYMWYPEEALALLTFVDAALTGRVRAHRLGRRLADRTRRERQAVWRATGAVDVPVPAEVTAALETEDAAAELAWEGIDRKMKRRIAKDRRARRDVECSGTCFTLVRQHRFHVGQLWMIQSRSSSVPRRTVLKLMHL
jgi:hypothetical protein